VISLGMVALMLSFALTIYRHYGSLDTGKRRLKE
jgi:multisubunit Na+/H+ antiporter MnhC subunit